MCTGQKQRDRGSTTGATSSRSRAAIVLSAGIIGALLWPAPTARADDELPRHACGLRIPFAMITDELQLKLDELIAETDLAQYSPEIINITITPHLGQLGYETMTWIDDMGTETTGDDTPRSIVRPIRLDTPEDAPLSPNNTNSSNDDYLEIIAKVHISDPIDKDIFFHIAVAFPQTRPAMVDPVVTSQ